MDELAADGGVDVSQADEFLPAEIGLKNGEFLPGERSDGLSSPIRKVQFVQGRIEAD